MISLLKYSKENRYPQVKALGDIGDLLFRDPEHFRVGELHEHVDSWKEIVTGNPTFHQSEVLSWI